MARRRNDGFERLSIFQRLTSPLSALWRWGSGLASDDKIQDRGSNPVVAVLLIPLRLLFSWIAFLVNSWALTRQVRPFLFGIPALFAVTGVAGAAWLDYYRYPNKVTRAQKYFEKFLSEPERGPVIAQHFALKRISLQPEDLQAKFYLAENWDRLDQLAKPEEREGNLFRALDLMSHLAEQDYALAHVWLARFYMSKRTEVSETLRAENIESHLKRAIEIDAESNSAKIALADHWLAKAIQVSKEDPQYEQYLREAQIQLTSVADTNESDIIWSLPKLMKVLFELASVTEDQVKKDEYLAKAKSVFEGSQKYLYQFMRKVPGDDRIPAIWQILIGSAIQLKDYKTAEQMIDEGRRQANNAAMSSLFDELSAQMIMRQVADLEDLNSSEQFGQALEILGSGILKFPTNATISNRLVEFIVPNPSDGKDLSAQLEKAQSVSAPSVGHLLMGIHLVLKGDAMGGKQYWRIASGQSSNAQIVLFSMIRSLVTVFSDKFENRRDVIALAIEEFPNQGLFYYLRGVDALKQNQNRQAIPDLEEAIKMIGEPENFEIRITLARCYRDLNDQEKFDEQRRMLQSQIQRSPPHKRALWEEYLSELDQ